MPPPPAPPTVDPASLPPLSLQIHPAPILRKRAAPVPTAPFPPNIAAITARMIEMMRAEEGIGLAAPQVGLSWRLFVVDVPPAPPHDGDRSPDHAPPTATRGPRVYINPRLTNPQGSAPPVAAEEGCLSLPDIRGDVLRPPVITITALDVEGREFTQTGGGLLARCWQHEMDHLDGILIIDRFTHLSRLKNRKAVRELERGG
ncbi:MAG: peptide deformylase [Phycisphaerales bacterium]|nr:peptide deformylase [Phycisphaerales bacterium]